MNAPYFLLIKSAFAALFLLLASSVGAQEMTFPTEELSIRTADGKTHVFSVELALTEAQRARGLMYRKEMAPDHGMLFDFGQARRVSMWMENTVLALDMLFIQRDGRISHIRENAAPFSRDIIDSQGPVSFVLELNAGRSKALGIKVGDTVVSPRIGNQR